jgi:hypothetical protein
MAANFYGVPQMMYGGVPTPAPRPQQRNAGRRRTTRGSKSGGSTKAVGSRAQVMHGTARHTAGGLTARDLMYNKSGKIVSKKKHELGNASISNIRNAGFFGKVGQLNTSRRRRSSSRSRGAGGAVNNPGAGAGAGAGASAPMAAPMGAVAYPMFEPQYDMARYAGYAGPLYY